MPLSLGLAGMWVEVAGLVPRDALIPVPGKMLLPGFCTSCPLSARDDSGVSTGVFFQLQYMKAYLDKWNKGGFLAEGVWRS